MTDKKLTLVYMKASELQDNPKNWRKHPKEQGQSLKSCIDKIGWAGACLYNKRTNRLIDGHLRKAISGDEEIPVLVGEWTEEEEKLILATLDPITNMAEPDKDILKQLLEDCKVEFPDLADVCISVSEVERVKLDNDIEEDEPPEPAKQSDTKPGTIIQLGPHRLMCGDSTNPEDMKKMIEMKVDAITTNRPDLLKKLLSNK